MMKLREGWEWMKDVKYDSLDKSTSTTVLTYNGDIYSIRRKGKNKQEL
jgi:hypothetical protein